MTVPVNWPNTGQVPNLPADVVAETKGLIDYQGVAPIAAGSLPTGIQGALMQHVANQELIVEAAVKGDRQPAMQALFNDPLVREVEAAKAVFDELLDAHREHLPQFHR